MRGVDLTIAHALNTFQSTIMSQIKKKKGKKSLIPMLGFIDIFGLVSSWCVFYLAGRASIVWLNVH